MQHVSRRGSEPLAEIYRAQLADLIAAEGEPRVHAALAVNRMTLARALAGLGLRRGTIALLEQRLREIAQNEKKAHP